MSSISVPALYDGEQIRLLEAAPVQGRYRVVVTFVEPESEQATGSELEQFWASFGSWQDDRPIDSTLEDIRQARASKPDPPAL